MTKLLSIAALLMLSGCETPPECARFHDGQLVKYKGETAMLDFVAFRPYVYLKGFNLKVECSCYDLEAL